MSSSYDKRGTSRRRGILTYWVPLAITVAIATAGVAAWAWTSREDDDDEEEDNDGLDYDDAGYDGRPNQGGGGGGGGGAGYYPDAAQRPEQGAGEGKDTQSTNVEFQVPTSWSNKVSGALRRTPSPHQMLSSAGKTMSAGVAAAGAAVGSALQSIREEDKTAYADHETWSEEADAKKERVESGERDKEAGKKRKVVALVVSSDTQVDELDQDGFEHAVCSVRTRRRNLESSIANGKPLVNLVTYPQAHRLLQDQTLRSDLCPGNEGRCVGCDG
jgi:hypothetical protein